MKLPEAGNQKPAPRMEIIDSAAGPRVIARIWDARPMPRVARVLISIGLGVCVLPASGCGQASRPVDPAHASPSGTSTTARALSAAAITGAGRRATDLQVVYFPHGAGSPISRAWSLRCAPPGGSHPSPAAACAEIERSPLALGRARHVCQTRALPGSPAATVAGTFQGRHVNRSYRPGCDDWQTLHVLLTGM